MINVVKQVFPVQEYCTYYLVHLLHMYLFHDYLPYLFATGKKDWIWIYFYFSIIAFESSCIQNYRPTTNLYFESRTSGDGVCRTRPHKTETEGSCVSLVQPYIIQMFWRARSFTGSSYYRLWDYIAFVAGLIIALLSAAITSSVRVHRVLRAMYRGRTPTLSAKYDKLPVVIFK